MLMKNSEKPIRRRLMLFGVGLLMLGTTTGCEGIRVAGSETERARCETIGKVLPTRSHEDTARTQNEIDLLYAIFEADCPDQVDLIP